MEPTDRTVLITGCSSGIGRATARAFLDAGWIVYATARDPDDVADLADAGCRTDALDVTEADAVERVVDRVIDEAGRIDCLVNNAGIERSGAVEDVTTDGLATQFDVNCVGVHRLLRAVVPHMRERGAGRVVNVGSVAGRFAVPAQGAYSASKFALRALTETADYELRPFGVRAILVEPPFVDTPLAADLDPAGEFPDTVYGRLYERFERFARAQYESAIPPSDVAETIRRAAEEPDPRTRYPVGLRARFQSLLGALPNRLRYRVWERAAD